MGLCMSSIDDAVADDMYLRSKIVLIYTILIIFLYTTMKINFYENKILNISYDVRLYGASEKASNLISYQNEHIGKFCSDVFFSIKTTEHYHRSRLPVIIDTWIDAVLNQVKYHLYIIMYNISR